MTERWREVRLAELCEGIFDGPHATPAKADSGPVFLGISSLDSGRLDLSQSGHISEDDYARWTRRVTPHAGDVVFSYETRLGQAAIIPAHLRCCLGRRLALLRPHRDVVDPRFLLYSYLSPAFQEVIRARTVHGSTVDRLLLEEVGDFCMAIPVLDVQQRIAAVLGALDDKIELNRRMTLTLHELADATYAQWLVCEPVPVLSKVGAMMDDGALTVGDGYRAKNTELSADGVPFARAADVDGIVRVGSGDALAHENVALAGEKLSRVWDVVVTTKGTVGRLAQVAPGTPPVVYSPQLCYWRVLREGALSPHVLYRWMRSREFRSQLDRHAGQTDMAPYVNLRDQRAFDITLPNRGAQRRIESALAGVDTRIALLYQESETLSELRDNLLPRLFSGELRVQEAEREVAGTT